MREGGYLWHVEVTGKKSKGLEEGGKVCRGGGGGDLSQDRDLEDQT